MGIFLGFLFFIAPLDANWLPLSAFLFYIFFHDCKRTDD